MASLSGGALSLDALAPGPRGEAVVLLSEALPGNRTALLAQVTEQSPEVVDTAMARLGGDVLRRPQVEVEDEIAAAQEAQRKAKHEARKELQKERLKKNKEAAHAKVEELQAKLHRPKAGAAG